jgi:hypothetical protein
MRLSLLVCAAIVCTALLCKAQEPVKPKLSPRIITATRQVTIFTDLEKQLLDAVQKKDKAAVQAMLSDDFAIYMPDADPLASEDWLDSVMSKDFVLKRFVIRQMDVADLGTAAVVSYDRVQESSFAGRNDGGEFYVVDLWKKDGDNWKLSARHVAKIGATAVMPKGPVKPTGKQ